MNNIILHPTVIFFQSIKYNFNSAATNSNKIHISYFLRREIEIVGVVTQLKYRSIPGQSYVLVSNTGQEWS